MQKDLILKRTRKNRDILSACGYGVIVFCLWGLIKILIWAFIIVPGLEIDPSTISSSNYFWPYVINTIILYIFSFLTGLFSVRNGKKDKNYIVLICIFSIPLVILNCLSLAYDIYIQIKLIDVDGFYIASTVIEVIFIYFSIRVMISSFLLKKYSKKLEKETA